MLGWYIGSANGPGNPYGLAAVMAVLSIVMMWCRLYAPPQHLPTAIIFGATIMLVIGYSYIDTQVVFVVQTGLFLTEKLVTTPLMATPALDTQYFGAGPYWF